MRALFFSDIHMDNHEQFSTTLPTGTNSRLQHQLDVLEQIRQLCLEKTISYVFMLGDTFHRRKFIDTDVMYHTFRSYKAISQVVNGNFYILVGNHDQHNKIGSVHSLEPFKEIAKVIDSPRQIVTEGLKFCAMPFTANIGEWKDVTKDWSGDLFIFHQGLSEATVGAYDVYIKAEIGLGDVPRDRFRYCFAGHYHKRQLFKSGNSNVTGFIGSPLQLSMGERLEDKGFTILDLGTGEIEFVESKAPKFRLFESAKEFDDFCFTHPVWNTSDFIRVRDADKYRLEKIKDQLPEVQVELLDEEKVLEPSRVDADTISNDKTLLESYIDQRGNSLDKKDLLKLGLDLLASED